MAKRKMKTLRFLLLFTLSAAAGPATPRIVNLYNFVRNSDYRLPNSPDVLFDATRRQIKLIHSARLPATWALQYDALINPRYQKLFRDQLGTNDEIAAWWEIPQPLAEKAGLKWRGQHEWDSAANVGFSPGYAPAERRQLVDIYMADFKAIFGAYPRTVGSWFIDEVTLEYMSRRYGIVASCNCKDQVGTDGYTLWGGYWNQAYYPSRLNAYMPAQTQAGQIDVPIFRMLGSDPIYQGYAPGMWTLEPVYPQAGGSPDWVASFMDNFIHQPALAFAYTQARPGKFLRLGRDENRSHRPGRPPRQTRPRRRNPSPNPRPIRRMVSPHFPAHAPPTCVVALDDWKHEHRQSVWYDTRFYRVNFLWENGAFFIRDLHRFDENAVSPTHGAPLATTFLAYETLPLMDAALWSATEKAGIWPVLLSPAGHPSPMTPVGPPVVKEINPTQLSITQTLADAGTFSLLCSETEIRCAAVDPRGRALPWAWDLIGGAAQKAVVQTIRSNSVAYRFSARNYLLQLAPNSGSCHPLENCAIRLTPNASGELVLLLNAGL